MSGYIFLLSIIITLLQLSDSYLRFLPFRQQLTAEVSERLWQALCLWGFASLLIYYGLFHFNGITALSYKLVLMTGWIPYMVIFLLMIRGKLCQHIFIFGMTAIWSFIQHNWGSIVVALVFRDFSAEWVIIIHAALYLVWFILLLPLERLIFSKLLPSSEFFEQRPIGFYIAILPFAILSAHWILLADSTLWHSWEERLSRLVLPIIFFFFYRYVLVATSHFLDKKRLSRNAKILSQQLLSLEDYQRFISRDTDLILGLRQELSNSYEAIAKMVQARQWDEAKKYIQHQEQQLSAAVIQPYSDFPLINAAISIYLARAQSLGISIKQKVNLPLQMITDENDFAILLSNLLENAIQGTSKEPNPALELIIQHNGKQCVLTVANRFSKPLKLGEDNLPLSSRQGHGIGMVSVKRFLEKYNGYVTFTQEKGWVRFFMYWRDEAPC